MVNWLSPKRYPKDIWGGPPVRATIAYWSPTDTHEAAVKLYLKSVGGGRPILYCVITLCIAFVSEFLDNLSYWYLGFWARQYEEHPPWEVNVPL